MGVAYFIVLEREIPGFDPFVNGKAVARAADFLNREAAELDVRPFDQFLSQDPDEARAFIEDEGGDPAEYDIPDEEWFDPRDALRTVDAFLAHLDQEPEAVPESPAVIDDLKEYQAVLRRAADEGVGFHLQIDF